MSTDFLRPIDDRLERVGRQVDEILAGASALVQSSGAQFQYRPNRLGFMLYPAGIEALPELQHSTSTCLHHLRSILDNLAFALARLEKDPVARPKEVSFPIFEDRKKFRQSKNWAQLPSEAIALMEQLQPYNRAGRVVGGISEGEAADDHLLFLRDLNNGDKHHEPLRLDFIPQEISQSVTATFETDEAASRNVPPDVRIDLPLAPGRPFFTYLTKDPLVSGTITSHLTANITLATMFSRRPLEIALPAMRGSVVDVVNLFRRFF